TSARSRSSRASSRTAWCGGSCASTTTARSSPTVASIAVPGTGCRSPFSLRQVDMSFAAAFSEHPVPAQAVGEAVGQILEQLGTDPDLVVLFVTTPFAGAMEDLADAVARLLTPRAFVGATASAVLGGERGVEDGPGLAL